MALARCSRASFSSFRSKCGGGKKTAACGPLQAARSCHRSSARWLLTTEETPTPRSDLARTLQPSHQLEQGVDRGSEAPFTRPAWGWGPTLGGGRGWGPGRESEATIYTAGVGLGPHAREEAGVGAPAGRAKRPFTRPA